MNQSLKSILLLSLLAFRQIGGLPLLSHWAEAAGRFMFPMPDGVSLQKINSIFQQ